MSFIEPYFKKLLWYLQCEEKADREQAFAKVQQELNDAIKALPFDYLKMMQLFKGLYLYLYKEDSIEKQQKISENIAKLIHSCPSQAEICEILCVEESYEAEEESPENEEIIANKDYGGPKTLFFRCALETLIREWNTVDYLRQSKFMYLARCIITEMLISGFQSPAPQLLQFIQTLELTILSNSRIKTMLVPRSLVLHIIDIWNDSLHTAVKHTKPTPQNFATAASTFGQFLSTLENEKEVENQILTQIFDDFTEISFYQEENFGNYLTKNSPTLADAFWILATECETQKENFENFAQQIEEYVEWWGSKESEKYRKNTAKQGLKIREKQHQIDLEVINNEAVRIAKQQKGDDWEQYVDKENEEWEYDPKLKQKNMRRESIYPKWYQKKDDDL